MNQVNSRTQEIITKIQSVDVLYRKASKRFINSTIRDKMQDILSVNSHFLIDLNDSISLSKLPESNMELEHRKYLKKIDSLNEKELLWMCLNSEEELVKLYQKAISYNQLKKPEGQLLKRQLFTSLSHFNQLKMVNESFHYQK